MASVFFLHNFKMLIKLLQSIGHGLSKIEDIILQTSWKHMFSTNYHNLSFFLSFFFFDYWVEAGIYPQLYWAFYQPVLLPLLLILVKIVRADPSYKISGIPWNGLLRYTPILAVSLSVIYFHRCRFFLVILHVHTCSFDIQRHLYNVFNILGALLAFATI